MQDDSLLRQHAEVLFRFDRDGRMLTANEPGEEPAPRVFVARGRASALAWFRVDVTAEVASECRAAVVRLPAWNGEPAPESLWEPLRSALSRNDPMREEVGVCFRFGEPVRQPPGPEPVEIDDTLAHLLERFFPYTRSVLAWRRPVLAIVEDGAVVSACYSPRHSSRACEAGVDTEEPYRGRGYAARVVAAWRDAVEREGRVPLYSTTWDNAASRAVARKLGLVAYAETLSLT